MIGPGVGLGPPRYNFDAPLSEGGDPDNSITEGAGNTDVAPGFVGPSDFRLASDSPLIDAGNPAGLIAGESTTDLAGSPRVVDGDPPLCSAGTPRRDIGAYEYQPPAACGPDTKSAKARINSARGKATFNFKAIGSSTGFQCALSKGHKKPKFKSCKSPKAYKHLKNGRYTFAVRAVGGEDPDPTPARKRFKIKK